MITWLSNLPVWWANAITVALFLAIAAGVFLVPRAMLETDAPDRARWRDVRLWAVALIAVQLGIYALFS